MSETRPSKLCELVHTSLMILLLFYFLVASLSLFPKNLLQTHHSCAPPTMPLLMAASISDSPACLLRIFYRLKVSSITVACGRTACNASMATTPNFPDITIVRSVPAHGAPPLNTSTCLKDFLKIICLAICHFPDEQRTMGRRKLLQIGEQAIPKPCNQRKGSPRGLPVIIQDRLIIFIEIEVTIVKDQLRQRASLVRALPKSTHQLCHTMTVKKR